LAAIKREGMIAYNGVCALCHNEDGAGKAGVAPTLVGSDWVNEADPGRLVRIVLHGLQGPIKINATTEFNVAGAAMPPQYDAIGGTDAKLSAVLTYIRTSWGNTAKAVTADEVKSARLAAGARSDMWSPEELKAVVLAGGAAAAAPAELTPEQLKEKLKALPADKLQELLKDVAK
jgi:nitrite reductase (NO-forming)